MLFKKKVTATVVSSFVLSIQVAHASPKMDNIYDLLDKKGIVAAGSPLTSNVFALSDSGNTALGFSSPSVSSPVTDVVATIWDSKKGTIHLAKADGYTNISEARAISQSGDTVAGFLSPDGGGHRAVYWDKEYY